MSLAFDTPDFSDYRNQQDTVLVNFNAVVGAGGTSLGTVQMGGAKSLIIQASVTGGPSTSYMLTISWNTGAVPAASAAQHVIEIESNGTITLVTIPVCGFSADMSIGVIGGPGGPSVAVGVIGSHRDPHNAQGRLVGSGNHLVNVEGQNLPASGSFTLTPNGVRAGICTLTLLSDKANYYATVRDLTAGDAENSVMAYANPAPSDGITIRFGLQPRRFRLTVNNLDAVAKLVWVCMDVDYDY